MTFSSTRRPVIRILLPLLAACCQYSTTALAEQVPQLFSVHSQANDKRVELDNYDEVLAQIPGKQAPARAVALAQINIALHQAKKIAERNLCSSRWAPRGKMLYQSGPTLQQVSAAPQQRQTWVYQSFRHPVDTPCMTRVSRSVFFQEMSRHLPEGFSIRPAGQRIAYARGKTLYSGRSTVFATR